MAAMADQIPQIDPSPTIVRGRFILNPAFEVVLLLLILGLAAYLRLHNVGENPGWYTDEATHLDIAHHLMQGRWQYLAVNQSTLLFARMPLFELTLTGAMRVFGVEMFTLRLLTGSLGVLSVGLLYGVCRRLLPRERLLPLLAALMLAIYPQAVLYSRFGVSYNLLTPMVLLALFGLTVYWRSGARYGVALAAGVVGIGFVSDLMIGSLVAPLLLVVFARRWRDMVWVLPLIALPFGLYTVLMLITVPDAFWFDLNYTLFRLNKLTLAGQIGNVALNYTTLLSQDVWFPIGLFGLFLLREAHFKATALLLLLLPLVVLGRTVALTSLSAYYMIPLLPLVALGAAAFVRYAPLILWRMSDFGDVIQNQSIRRLAVMSLILFVIGVPLMTSLALTLNHVNGHYQTAIDPFLLDPAAVQQAAEFINDRTTPDDVVIASPAMAWLLTAHAADFQMSVSAMGLDSIHIPSNLPPERYAFDPRLENARFVVVDDLWRNWGVVHIPQAARMLQEVERWTLVFEAGSLQVYEK